MYDLLWVNFWFAIIDGLKSMCQNKTLAKIDGLKVCVNDIYLEIKAYLL